MIAVIYNYVARKQSSIEAITEYGFKIHQKEGRFEIKEGEEDCVLYPSSTKLMKFLKQEKLASGRVYRSYTKFSKRRNWAIHNLVSYSMLPNMQDKRTKKNLRVYPKDVETAYKQGDYVMEQLGLETERLSSNQKTGFLSYQKQEPRKSDEILPKPNLPPVCSAP
ncbi:MAG TPA: hypothetical protein VN739_04470 [Nitrososphaerales archaeon]|nr:hypothetical protein [Nitrososphaerales archaeon]